MNKKRAVELSEEEYNKRVRVWEVMSNFYLDTELQPEDYDYLANILLDTDYSVEQLKDIDLYEVFPLLQGNLLNMFGEWTGFDSGWLASNCLQNYEKRNHKPFRIITSIKNRLHYWMRKEHWDEIEKRMNTIS